LQELEAEEGLEDTLIIDEDPVQPEEEVVDLNSSVGTIEGDQDEQGQLFVSKR
jgi:hypothetical protein